MRDKIRLIVESNTFQFGVLGLILLAAAVVGLETSRKMTDRFGSVFTILNSIILWIFVLEAVLKMAQHGKCWYRYFKDPWNLFDFFIVAVCFLPIQANYAAVFRIARIVRSLRLVTALPKLQLIVNCLLKSIPSMFYVGILLALMFYVYGVVGVFLFSENDPVHFRNLPMSLLSLFRVVTLEDWTDVMYIQMLGSDVYAYENTTGIIAKSIAQPIGAAIYFVSFVLFGTMIILNLFIGVIINSMTEAQEETVRRQIGLERESSEGLSLAAEIDCIEGQIDDLKLNLKKLKYRLDDSQIPN
ncbi:MAG: ion transporter [Pirellulales bacterium]|jgi:voltage-gated sodium channel